MSSPHTEEIRRKRAEAERSGGHLLGYAPNGGAPMHRSTGYYKAPYSDIDYNKLLNAGMREEEALVEAQRLHREGKRIDPDGVQRTNDNPSDRARALREEATRQSRGEQSNAEFAGATAPPKPGAPAITDPAAKGNTPVVGDPFGTGHKPLTPDNPFAPAVPHTAPTSTGSPPRRPVDPSTVRQPAPRVGPPTDAAGNPASDSNPVAGTPAELRQMARDSATGRTVSTSGTPGVKQWPTGAPTQASNFRREISSQYGTGSNVSRTPDQGPATMVDNMGRTVPMAQGLADQSAVQATKLGPNATQAGEDYYNPAVIRKSVADRQQAQATKDKAKALADNQDDGGGEEETDDEEGDQQEA